MRGRIEQNSDNNNNVAIERELSLQNISKADDDQRYILPNQPLNRPKSSNCNNTKSNNNNQDTYSALTNFSDDVYAATNSMLTSDDQYAAITSNDQYSAIASNDQYSSLTLKGQYSTPIHMEPPKPSDDYAVLEKKGGHCANLSSFFGLENDDINRPKMPKADNHPAPENEYFVLESKDEVSPSGNNDGVYSSLELFNEQHYN